MEQGLDGGNPPAHKKNDKCPPPRRVKGMELIFEMIFGEQPQFDSKKVRIGKTLSAPDLKVSGEKQKYLLPHQKAWMEPQSCQKPPLPSCAAFPWGNIEFLRTRGLSKTSNIPPLVFVSKLQVLDLSYTSIKSLPQSISALTKLEEFFLRGCELLMELPPEIGALKNLQVFDLKGTEMMYLPAQIGELKNLRCLNMSFSGHGNRYRATKRIKKRISRGALLGLFELNELCIDVNPDDKEWATDVRYVICELQMLPLLKKLELYLPAVKLLQQIMSQKWWRHSGMSHFKFLVGLHDQHVMSHIPRAVEQKFEQWDKCLKYINGEGIPMEVKNALRYADAFFLERHWTVRSLSEFRIENMVQLQFCLLMQCNELCTVIDGEEFYQKGSYDHKPLVNEVILGSLRYLDIHYVKSLEGIWKGPVGKGSLSNLQSLALHTCPNLTEVFNQGLLINLNSLEELIVEDCPKINCLVSEVTFYSESYYFLPKLKKISLLDLPELVDISRGLCIAPNLEILIIYNCQKLETLSAKEVSSKDLKMIKGEYEWWGSLNWSDWGGGIPQRFVDIFEPITRNGDLMDQLA